MAKLNKQQLAFVKAYCRHGNGTQAVYDAGWKPRTRPAAAQKAYELLQQDNIADALQQAMSDNGVIVRRIVGELINQSFGRDISAFEDYMAGKKTLADLKEEGVNLRLVKKVRQRERTTGPLSNPITTKTCEVELVDGQKSLEMLGRIMGIFRQDEQTTATGPPKLQKSALANLRKRREAARKKSPHLELMKDDD